MHLVILLAVSIGYTPTDAGLLSGLGQWNLMVMQGRIVLRSGPGGGVDVKPDPYTVNRSYSHGARPLFSSQTSHAAAPVRPGTVHPDTGRHLRNSSTHEKSRETRCDGRFMAADGDGEALIDVPTVCANRRAG